MLQTRSSLLHDACHTPTASLEFRIAGLLFLLRYSSFLTVIIGLSFIKAIDPKRYDTGIVVISKQVISNRFNNINLNVTLLYYILLMNIL